MTLPIAVSSTLLWQRLASDEELRAAMTNIRDVAATLAATIARDVPTFTDHSIVHMDALWHVGDQILSEAEMQQVQPAEAFLLGASFYLHDIGMAYAATSAGLAELRQSSSYRGFLAQFEPEQQLDTTIQRLALSFAIRSMHAEAAELLSVSPIPGTVQYLIEPQVIREQWGHVCGRIAASHHWDVKRVESQFPSPGKVPLPGNRSGDPGYAAAILRIIDYAHINRDRAPKLQRVLTPQIELDSLVHWRAQEHIDGPSRAGDEIVYSSSEPVQDVDAWWLYSDMIKGLDLEIRQVRAMLDRRSDSVGRFSLRGVRGAGSAESLSSIIKTAGFLPLEVHLRTGSLDRVVSLLAGESLYGKTPMAPVRELLQNARDAVTLKKHVARDAADRAAADLPITVSIRTQGDEKFLAVSDWGIGMSKSVITDQLLTIASDYWQTQFHLDFPDAPAAFSPAGKFGIGFLSVFMLGDQIRVTSGRTGDLQHKLTLTGLERRGELRPLTVAASGRTTVEIKLNEKASIALKDLGQLIPAFVPMLGIPVEVVAEGVTTTIPTTWIHDKSTDDFANWIVEALKLIRPGVRDEQLRIRFGHRIRYFDEGSISKFAKDDIWNDDPPEYREEGVRLIASTASTTLLCLKGISLQSIPTPGFLGIINTEEATPNAARREALDLSFIEPILQRARDGVRDAVVQNVDKLSTRGFIPERTQQLTWCVDSFGCETLLQSSLKWIPIVHLSGDVTQISMIQFKELAGSRDSIFIMYKGGPWTALRQWKIDQFQQPNCREALCADFGSGPHYKRYEETEMGTLLELWPDWKGVSLFELIVSQASLASGIPVRDLEAQDGWSKKAGTLWGFLRLKPDKVLRAS